MENVSVLAAFIAGILSFLSPCVLPIVPAYLSYLSGNVSFGKKTKNFDMDILLASLFFVAGFTTVFTVMGLSASFIGGLFRDYSYYISKVGGALVVFFGLHFSGILIKKDFLKYLGAFEGFLFSFYAFNMINLKTFEQISAIVAIVFALYMLNFHNILYQQFKISDESVKLNTKKGLLKYVFAFVVGLSFAFGWTPCIGPVLGSILFYASQESTLYKGAYLLFVYSIGLGVPFILAGALFGAFIDFLKRFKRAFEMVEILGGVLLILMGLFLVLGKISIVSNFIS